MPNRQLHVKGYRSPRTRDIPTVTLTNLPVVTNASFEPYLSSIGPDYERHRRFKQGLLEEHIRIGSTETSVVPASSFTDLIDSKFLVNISTSNLSTSSLEDTIQSPFPCVVDRFETEKKNLNLSKTSPQYFLTQISVSLILEYSTLSMKIPIF